MGQKPLMLAHEEAEWVNALVRRDMAQKLELYARMMATSKSSIVRWALEEYLTKKMTPSN